MKLRSLDNPQTSTYNISTESYEVVWDNRTCLIGVLEAYAIHTDNAKTERKFWLNARYQHEVRRFNENRTPVDQYP